MVTRIGINGFGRIGRLAVRALQARDDLQLVHVNELNGSADTAAHLLEFDSIHGRYDGTIAVESAAGGGEQMLIDGMPVTVSNHDHPTAIPWSELGVDLVLECSGAFRTVETLQPHLDAGARRVVVAAPVKDESVPDIVLGCNDDRYDLTSHPMLTAASCTTNCLAPVVKVLHDEIGIERGVVTTIHDATNTQVVIDAPLEDLRRARSASQSLIPTTTGSATAITRIFPDLEGRLDGVAVRVPVLNASLTDAVFGFDRAVSVDEVNELLRHAASEGPLVGILGFEDRPLVSVDYVNDTRSGIVDGPSTMVVDDRLVKVLIWYDNEYGYAFRLVELAALAAGGTVER